MLPSTVCVIRDAAFLVLSLWSFYFALLSVISAWFVTTPFAVIGPGTVGDTLARLTIV